MHMLFPKHASSSLIGVHELSEYMIAAYIPSPWPCPEMGALLLVQGVGMILPIEASMHTPAHFDGVLAGTMAAVTALYVGFGSVINP